MSNERDGFVIEEIDTGREEHFVPCAKDGRMREKVEDGLYRRVNIEKYAIFDTREND